MTIPLKHQACHHGVVGSRHHLCDDWDDTPARWLEKNLRSERLSDDPGQALDTTLRSAMATLLRRSITVCLGLGMIGSSISAANACTSFTLQGNDGGHVYARTMEFSQPLNSEAILIQRGTTLRGVGPSGQPGSGLEWTGRYAVIGLNAVGVDDLVADGMNEKGLAGGLLYFLGYAQFQNVPEAQRKRSIAAWQLLTYVLSNFETIAEVKQELPKVLVNGSPLKAFGGIVPIHMTLHDRSGKSLSVEYIKGDLNMRDNPTGVYTNNPPLPYHLAAAGNVANLKAMPPAEITMNGVRLPPTSSGGGMHGLPGDFMSTSRFIRALIISNNAPTNLSTEEQVSTAFHMLGQFDLPPGSVGIPSGGTFGGGGKTKTYEITEWSVVADQKNGTYSIQTFDNRDVRQMRFEDLPLSGGDIKVMPLDQPQKITTLMP